LSGGAEFPETGVDPENSGIHSSGSMIGRLQGSIDLKDGRDVGRSATIGEGGSKKTVIATQDAVNGTQAISLEF
jgi:hypothetical protein